MDVLRVGPLFICRSCGIFYPAALLTALLAIWVTPSPGLTLLALLCAPPLATLHARLSRWRLARDASRLTLGLCVGLTLASPLSHGAAWLLSYGALALTVQIIRARRDLNVVDRCEGCEHLNGGRACPGFERQVKASLEVSGRL